MSIQGAFASHAEARKAGWFSRRHQTDAAHRAEQDRYQVERRDKTAREERQRQETADYKAKREQTR